MQQGTKITLTRDFPRIGAKQGDEAIVTATKGEGVYEIALFGRGIAIESLIVMAEWIKKKDSDERAA